MAQNNFYKEGLGKDYDFHNKKKSLYIVDLAYTFIYSYDTVSHTRFAN